MITRAIPGNRPHDHRFDEISSKSSFYTEKINVEKSKQTIITDFQIQAQTIYVVSIPNVKIMKSPNVYLILNLPKSHLQPLL